MKEGLGLRGDGCACQRYKKGSADPTLCQRRAPARRFHTHKNGSACKSRGRLFLKVGTTFVFKAVKQARTCKWGSVTAPVFCVLCWCFLSLFRGTFPPFLCDLSFCSFISPSSFVPFSLSFLLSSFVPTHTNFYSFLLLLTNTIPTPRYHPSRLSLRSIFFHQSSNIIPVN